jgi:hypothetical protein
MRGAYFTLLRRTSEEGQKQGALAAASSLLRFSPRWTGAPVSEEISERERVAASARAIHALVKSL